MDGSTPPCCPHTTGDYWKTCLQGLNERALHKSLLERNKIEGNRPKYNEEV